MTKLGAVVYGVSKDSLASHERFGDKHDLNFVLLSDESSARTRSTARDVPTDLPDRVAPKLVDHYERVGQQLAVKAYYAERAGR